MSGFRKFLDRIFGVSPNQPPEAGSSWESHTASKGDATAGPGVPPATHVSDLGSYQPKLAEFIALLHHETQQAIEHLAQPELHRILQKAPSASFVKIERMHIDVPVRLLIQHVKISEDELVKLPILYQPLLLPDDVSLAVKVSVLNPKTGETTKDESKLRVEFSVAAK